MEILKIKASQFRGVADGEYEFRHFTNVEGANGSGKSTILSMILWVFGDCDYNLVSKPMIEPLNMKESKPTVTIWCNSDGKDFSVTKTQKITKDETGRSTAANNSYMVNDVPITQRDYKKKMLDYGINLDLFTKLAHPSVAVSMKQMDLRKNLFEMTTEKSDLDIASMDDEMKELAALLTQYTVDEISAKYKASKKKASEMIEAIPNQIIGLERAKVNEDPKPLIDALEELDKQIKQLEEERKKLDKTDEREDIRRRLFDAKRAVSDAENKLRTEASVFKRHQAEATLEIKHKINSINERILKYKEQATDAKYQLSENNRIKNDMARRWKELKASKFPAFEAPQKLSEKDMVCPTCGQELPETLRQKKIQSYEANLKRLQKDYQERKKTWADTVKAEMESVKENGQKACDSVRDAESKLEKIAIGYDNANKELEDARTVLAKAQEAEEVEFVPEQSFLDKLEELKKNEAYLEQLLTASMEISENDNDMKLGGEITALRIQRRDIEKRLDVIENNEAIDEQIADLQKERNNLEQKRATADMVLYQLDLLSQKKNELLVDEINSHFSLVKWQLFEYQKNSKYKEICVPTIDGYRFGESTNTGREIVAKLDICNSLQKFYGMSVPILLDNAESLNRINLPKVDSQLIIMTVTDSKGLVFRYD